MIMTAKLSHRIASENRKRKSNSLSTLHGSVCLKVIGAANNDMKQARLTSELLQALDCRDKR